MKRIGGLLLVIAALAGLAAGLWAVFASGGGGEEWSCEPERAREELEAGLAASMKFYQGDALEHFERALELSPDCAMARLAVVRRLPWGTDRQKRLLAELEATDLDGLPDREVFLVRYWLAELHEEPERQREILDAYLERHPGDPFALEYRCERLWAGERYDEGESCYERLLRLNPNWIVAQNRLGYLAMARGSFDRAEDRFRTYRYVAPDQANPHDSLGELLVLRGRYEEAEAELEAALAVRPDFCASYGNLIFAGLDRGDPEAARAALARGLRQEPCDGLRRLECEIDAFALYLERDWEGLAARWGEPCHGEKLAAPWLPHFGALMIGDLELAGTIEGQLADLISKYGGEKMSPRDVDLLRGLRLLAEGRPAEAETTLRRADEGLLYRNLGIGRFKLFIRLALAEALRRQGKTAESEALVREVAAVNPHYAEIYRSGELPLPGA
ncbi:MAG: tetratricopeptide repeat protein [Acidobacteriota bacterium]|jgi:tetratricopeptide (TPR) repeat protein